MANLEDLLQQAGADPVKLVRSSKWHTKGARQNEALRLIPQIPYEFSRWPREMRAWRETVALLDQSHHMVGVFIRGPDVLKLLSRLACNKLQNSKPNRAFQIICCNEDGFLIGDGILFHLATDEFSVYGAPFVPNWIRYQAAQHDFDVQVTADYPSPVYANGHGNTRPDFRYQIQGPNAGKLIEKLNGGPIGDVKFFHMTEMAIAGQKVRALRHGMAGTPGLEIWGKWEHRDAVRAAIVHAGEEFGIVKVGSAAYLCSVTESGWIAGILPAIYSPKMKAYREWLADIESESRLSVVGSYYSDSIEDYYRTPYDVEYGRLVDFEHDFIGRDALMKIDGSKANKKVTLLWNVEDAGKVFAAMLNPSAGAVRHLHLPYSDDAFGMTYDRLSVGDKMVGVGYSTGLSANERSLLTLATVDREVPLGSEVVLHWAEAGGGYGEGQVQPTTPIEVRTIVSPAPYSVVARGEYRK